MTEKKNASNRERGQREPRGPAEQPPVREPRRDERAHVGRIRVLDALQPLLLVGADVREAREHLPLEVHRERMVVGIARVGERGRGVELMAGLDAHHAHADARVDLEHARERDRPAVRLERLRRAGVVRERAVADAGEHDDAALGRRRGTTTSAAASRGCAASAASGSGLTVAEQVERVAGEHDRRPGRGTPRSRARSSARPRGRCRFRPAPAAARRTRAPARREQPGRETSSTTAGRRDARSTRSAPVVRRCRTRRLGPVRHRHRPQSSACPRPAPGRPRRPD